MKSKKSRTWLMLFSALLALPPAVLHADDDDDDGDDDIARFVANEIVVKLNPASGAGIDQIHAQYATATLSTMLESAGIYLIGAPEGADLEQLVDDLDDDARLLYAEPNYITSVPQSDGHVIWAWSGGAPVSGTFPQELVGQAPTQSLDLPAVRPLSTGAGVVVAVLDTGVDFAHPNLAANLLDTGYDFVDDDAVPQDLRMNLDADGDGKTDENFGHGSHVAGAVLLAAPDAWVLPIRVLDSEGQGNTFILAEAIDYAVRAGAHIINLSLGMDVDSDLLDDAIEFAEDADVLIVAAAGNANSDLPRFPAADDDVLGVASVGGDDRKSPFTNWGSWIGVSAPGEAVVSAFPGDAYAAWSGTSMAAPLVAGQAALLKALDPDLDDDDLIDLIRRTAFNIDPLNPDWQQKLGAGRVDLLASLQAVRAGSHDDDDDDEDDGRDDDDEGRDDDDDDDGRDDALVSLEQAIARLQQGWDDAHVSVEGVPVALIDDDDYRFAIGETEVVLELWDDDIVLVIGEPIRVTGELEEADDDDRAAGLLYELDAAWIEDLAGNRIGDDDDDDRDDDDLRKDYGKRAEGTLADLIALLESRQDDDLNVRVTGTLGQRLGNGSDDDEDYRFTDESGVTVILDLDSRANLRFALTPGMQLDIIGELERVDDDDDDAPAGVAYELDAVWIRLADGTALDIGQLTPLAGATISDWIGFFWKLDDDDGWFDHPTKGLIFTDDTLDDDDWFLCHNRDEWFHVSRDWYPLIFSRTSGWYLLVGSAFGERQHAYSFEKDEWILDFWRKGP
jgi:subtilisin family serine protease/uncharacterized protein YdeI (BOF family)